MSIKRNIMEILYVCLSHQPQVLEEVLNFIFPPSFINNLSSTRCDHLEIYNERFLQKMESKRQRSRQEKGQRKQRQEEKVRVR